MRVTYCAIFEISIYPPLHHHKSYISSPIWKNYERFRNLFKFSCDLDQAGFCSSNRLEMANKRVKELFLHNRKNVKDHLLMGGPFTIFAQTAAPILTAMFTLQGLHWPTAMDRE